MTDQWDKVADLIIDAGHRLEAGGVESIILCANTPHKVFEIVAHKLKVPIIHIADTTAAAIKAKGLKKSLLLRH
ncbi:MAG: aspartate racemase [Roseivirga sp.]